MPIDLEYDNAYEDGCNDCGDIWMPPPKRIVRDSWEIIDLEYQIILYCSIQSKCSKHYDNVTYKQENTPQDWVEARSTSNYTREVQEVVLWGYKCVFNLSNMENNSEDTQKLTEKVDKRKSLPQLFTPWKSGNPAGRPKWARSVSTLFREAIEKLEKDQKIEDVERDLVTVIIHKAKKGDLKAMEMYLDRLYWKPKQDITNTIREAKSEIELWE